MKANLFAALIVALVCAVLGIMYLSFFDFREPPIRIIYSHPVAVASEVKSRAELVDSGPVASGKLMYAYREYCITNGHQVLRNERWLIPLEHKAKPVPLPLLPTRILRGLGCENTTFSSQIPLGTPPGDYIFQAKWIYMLDGNPIATFRWNWPDVRVTVR